MKENGIERRGENKKESGEKEKESGKDKERGGRERETDRDRERKDEKRKLVYLACKLCIARAVSNVNTITTINTGVKLAQVKSYRDGLLLVKLCIQWFCIYGLCGCFCNRLGSKSLTKVSQYVSIYIKL